MGGEGGVERGGGGLDVGDGADAGLVRSGDEVGGRDVEARGAGGPGELLPGGGIIAAGEQGLHADGQAIDAFEVRVGVGLVVLFLRVLGAGEGAGGGGIAGDELPAPSGGVAVGALLGGDDFEHMDHAVSERDGPDAQLAEIGDDDTG